MPSRAGKTTPVSGGHVCARRHRRSNQKSPAHARHQPNLWVRVIAGAVIDFATLCGTSNRPCLINNNYTARLGNTLQIAGLAVSHPTIYLLFGIMITNNVRLIDGKLKEIAEHLSNYPDLPAPEQRPCLFTGRRGEALFLMHFAQYAKSDSCFDLAVQRIEESFEIVDNGYGLFSLSGGLAGIFWTIEHLIELGYLSEDTRESLEPFDQPLAEVMLNDIARGNFDFMHSALGIALYLLKRRQQNPTLESALIKCVEGLKNCAQQADGNSLKWIALLNSETGETGPNICLSHGMASIAIMLSKFIENNIAREQSTALLHQTVNYILAQEIDPAEHLSYFPSMSLENPGQQMLTSRIAWCYGDLGVALALYRAGKAADMAEWRDKGLKILLYSCSRRGVKMNTIKDAGLCHGTAGVALIFQRLFLDTGLQDFEEAAGYWHEQTLSFATIPEGPAGFLPYTVQEAVQPAQARGFLLGISGIGLSLLHAVSDIRPDWDECLLLS
jgi:lantibiotic modifying enzyme